MDKCSHSQGSPRGSRQAPSVLQGTGGMSSVDGETCSAVHYQPKQSKTLPVQTQGGAGYETEADLWYQAQQAADTLSNTQTGRRHPNWSQAPKLVAGTQASEPNMIKPNPNLLEG